MNGGGTDTGKLVVISGPSGSGKTTGCGRLLSDPSIMLSVSVTTRAPRPGEKDGENYYFISRDEFCIIRWRVSGMSMLESLALMAFLLLREFAC